MQCWNCSAKIEDNADVCPHCGSGQDCSAELIERAKQNDRNAVTALYRCTYSSVYYTVKALIKDEDTTEDIIQDSYIKIFRNLYRLNKPENCKAWIQMVARNTAIDYLRRRKPILFSDITSLDEENPADLLGTAPENLPEVIVDRRETKRLMKKILREIPEEQRLVIMMHYYEQVPVKRIAKELGISEGTVKSRLNYGRKKIEEKVRQLEKNGTKLYGLAPVAFLALVLHSWSAVPVKSSGTVLKNILTVLYGSQEASHTTGALSATGSAARSSARLALLSSAQNAAAVKITAGICIFSVIGGTAVGTIAEQYHEQPLSASYAGTVAKPSANSIGYNRSAPYITAGTQDDNQTWYEDPVQTYYTQEYIQDDAPAEEEAPAQQEEQADTRQAQENTPAQPAGAQQAQAQAAGEQTQAQPQTIGGQPETQPETRAPVDNPLDNVVGYYRAVRNTSGVYTDSLNHYAMTLPDVWSAANASITEEVLEDEALGNYMQLSFLFRNSSRRSMDVFSLRLISTNISVTDSSYTRVAGNDIFNVYRVPAGKDEPASAADYDALSDDDKAAYDTLLQTADDVISSFTLL